MMLFAALDAEAVELAGACAITRLFPTERGPHRPIDMDTFAQRATKFRRGSTTHPGSRRSLRTCSAAQPSVSVRLRMVRADPRRGLEDSTQLSDHGPFHERRVLFGYFEVEDRRRTITADQHGRSDRPGGFGDTASMIVDEVRNVRYARH